MSNDVAAYAEFGFMQDMPKREQTKLTNLWDRLKVFKDFMAKNGECVPLRVASGLVGVSDQRIYTLIEEARLTSFRFEGHPYVSVASIEDYCKSERKAGRPVKNLDNPSLKERAKLSLKIARDVVGRKPK